jgi:hypothetical protein
MEALTIVVVVRAIGGAWWRIVILPHDVCARRLKGLKSTARALFTCALVLTNPLLEVDKNNVSEILYARE